MFLADEKQVIGLIAVADQIKLEAKQAIKQLQNKGLDVFMLTGDNKLAAERLVNKLVLIQSISLLKYFQRIKQPT